MILVDFHRARQGPGGWAAGIDPEGELPYFLEDIRIAREAYLQRGPCAKVPGRVNTGTSEQVLREPRLHEKCSDARRATKVVAGTTMPRSATTQMGIFRTNPHGAQLSGRSALSSGWRRGQPFAAPDFAHPIPESPRRGHAGLVQRFHSGSVALFRGKMPETGPEHADQDSLVLIGDGTMMADEIADMVSRTPAVCRSRQAGHP